MKWRLETGHTDWEWDYDTNVQSSSHPTQGQKCVYLCSSWLHYYRNIHKSLAMQSASADNPGSILTISPSLVPSLHSQLFFTRCKESVRKKAGREDWERGYKKAGRGDWERGHISPASRSLLQLCIRLSGGVSENLDIMKWFLEASEPPLPKVGPNQKCRKIHDWPRLFLFPVLRYCSGWL